MSEQGRGRKPSVRAQQLELLDNSEVAQPDVRVVSGVQRAIEVFRSGSPGIGDPEKDLGMSPRRTSGYWIAQTPIGEFELVREDRHWRILVPEEWDEDADDDQLDAWIRRAGLHKAVTDTRAELVQILRDALSRFPYPIQS